MNHNFNDKIVIKLTKEGVDLYKKYIDSLSPFEDYYPGLEGDQLTITIWEFAHIFGPESYMGNPKQFFEMTFKFQ